MHVRSLKIFCDVVGRRSFSRAAVENGISQSGASQTVQQLEDNLDVKLIDRSKRPFVLTPEGEIFHQGCRRIVQRYQALVEEVRSLHRDVEGRVNIASIYSVGLSYGNQLIELFTGQYPRATVHIEFHSPQRVYELVGSGQVDLGLVSFAQSTKVLSAIEWCREPITLICSPDHELAKRKVVRSQDIHQTDIIGFDPDLRIRKEIDRYLARQHIEVRVDIAFDNIDTIKRAIEVNAGASFLPYPAVRDELRSGSLVAVSVEGFEMFRPLGIIHRRRAELCKSVRYFIDMLQKNRDLPADGRDAVVSHSPHAAKPRFDSIKDTRPADAVSAGK